MRASGTRWWWLALCLVLACPSVVRSASPPPDERVVRLATAEWPPYLGEALDGQGALARLLSDAFARRGYRLELEFYPWARVLQRVRDPAAHLDGYVVDYFSEQVAADYLLSRPVTFSPLVFAERTTHPVPWKTFDDLRQVRLGLVSGYTNTQELDRLVAAGHFATEAVSDDLTNLRRLAAGRVDLVTIDEHVFDWLVRTDPVLARQRGALRVSGRVLEQKALHACFRKSARGAALRQALDDALAGIDTEDAVHRFIRAQTAGQSRR